jgi:hypothetical protein
MPVARIKEVETQTGKEYIPELYNGVSISGIFKRQHRAMKIVTNEVTRWYYDLIRRETENIFCGECGEKITLF